MTDLAIGQVQWHSSEEDGGPDVGILVGLGDGKALWLGEIADGHGLGAMGLAIYQGMDAQYLPLDYEGVRDVLEHHVAPLLRQVLDPSTILRDKGE